MIRLFVTLIMNTSVKYLLTGLVVVPVSHSSSAQQNFLNITNYRVYYGWAHNSSAGLARFTQV